MSVAPIPYTLTRKAWTVMTDDDRCRRTDLPRDGCGDVCCRPDLHVPDLPNAVPGSRRGAMLDSTCPECGNRIYRGTVIALTIVDRGVGRWVHEGCTVEGNQ